MEASEETRKAVDLVNRIYDRLLGRRAAVTRAEDYYEGRQPLHFATEEWRKANAARYSGFSDNWCGTVVNAEAERLKPLGITIPGAKRDSVRLWDELQRNEFDAQFSQGVVAALATSRAYAIVWGDRNDKPVVSIEHPAFVEIEYDFENPRRRRAALKTWVDDENEYATLYTPKYVWKFERKRISQPNERDSQAEQGRENASWQGGWVPRDGADDVWPIPNPLGEVPVVELPNRPTLKGDPISEIQGVMAMQDAINLLWAYLFLAADYASMKARVVTGSDAPKVPILDENGQQTGYRSLDLKDFAEKRIAFLPGDAKIDQWDAADLEVFTKVIEIAVGHIAVQTRTPQHYLVANSERPNGAFEAQEAGLQKKADEFITFTDPALREVFRLMALVEGNAALAERCRLALVVWKSRAIRSESQLADALLKKRQMGYPLSEILAMDGFSPRDIERIVAAAEREAAIKGADAPKDAPGNTSGNASEQPSETDSAA